MGYNLKTKNQIGFFYTAAAKPLYNLALYTIGDPVLAQQVTIDAFDDAFHSFTDKTDLELFMDISTKLLFQYIRKARENDFDQAVLLNTAGDINNDRQKKYMDMLCRLSPKERYIVFLFCWQRFSLKRIAKTISGTLPLSSFKFRLAAATLALTNASYYQTRS